MAIAGSTIGACWVMHRESVKMHQELSKEMGREMKDFHGRLCSLEEKYIQMMQRILERKE
jgi:hypothetical protein